MGTPSLTHQDLPFRSIHHTFYPLINCFKPSRAINTSPGLLVLVECGQFTKGQTLKEHWCIFSNKLSVANNSSAMIDFCAPLHLVLLSALDLNGCLVCSCEFYCVNDLAFNICYHPHKIDAPTKNFLKFLPQHEISLKKNK